MASMAATPGGRDPVGVAKAGVEEGVSAIGRTAIIAPSGRIVALTATLGDELTVYRCDLDLVKP
jgi:hypothetical protein